MEFLPLVNVMFEAVRKNPELIPTVLCIFLGYLHIVWRREEREDRQKMLEAFGKITEAMNEVKVALAAKTGNA